MEWDNLTEDFEARWLPPVRRKEDTLGNLKELKISCVSDGSYSKFIFIQERKLLNARILELYLRETLAKSDVVNVTYTLTDTIIHTICIVCSRLLSMITKRKANSDKNYVNLSNLRFSHVAFII